MKVNTTIWPVITTPFSLMMASSDFRVLGLYNRQVLKIIPFTLGNRSWLLCRFSLDAPHVRSPSDAKQCIWPQNPFQSTFLYRLTYITHVYVCDGTTQSFSQVLHILPHHEAGRPPAPVALQMCHSEKLISSRRPNRSHATLKSDH